MIVKPSEPATVTYTITVSQTELDILQSIVGNTAGITFQNYLGLMYRALKNFKTPSEPHTLVIDGVSYSPDNTLFYSKE